MRKIPPLFFRKLSGYVSQIKWSATAIFRTNEKSELYNTKAKAYTEASNLVSKITAELSQHMIDEGFSTKSHTDRHMTIPWCDTITQRLRDNVFITAVNSIRLLLTRQQGRFDII